MIAAVVLGEYRSRVDDRCVVSAGSAVVYKYRLHLGCLEASAERGMQKQICL